MARRIYEHPGFEYKEVEVVGNISQTAKVVGNIAKTANQWEDEGWETISVIPPVGLSRPNFTLFLKRVKPNPFSFLENPKEFQEWDDLYGGQWAHRRRSIVN